MLLWPHEYFETCWALFLVSFIHFELGVITRASAFRLPAPLQTVQTGVTCALRFALCAHSSDLVRICFPCVYCVNHSSIESTHSFVQFSTDGWPSNALSDSAFFFASWISSSASLSPSLSRLVSCLILLFGDSIFSGTRFSRFAPSWCCPAVCVRCPRFALIPKAGLQHCSTRPLSATTGSS